MTDGDEDAADTPENAESQPDGDADEQPSEGGLEGTLEPAEMGPDEFENHLDSIEAALEAAETEADLDDVEADLDAVADALDEAELPEPEEEDEEAPADALEERVSSLRDQIEEARGPYAEDVVESVEESADALSGPEWTDAGVTDVRDAGAVFLSAVEDALGESVDAEVADDADPAAVATALRTTADAVSAADLDPDEDSDTLEDLDEAAAALADDVEAAETYDDLSVRGQLEYEGFYDAMGEKHKDFPPEWSALKQWESRGNAEMVLLLLEKMGDSEFIERHCLDTLERMGPPEAFDEMEQRATRRDKRAIDVLGSIADDAALDTIGEFVGPDNDDGLRKVTLRAIGRIGSEESTQLVADQLVDDDPSVRSRAARTLGLIGDARAVEPLADVLEEDDDDAVRASAAWALVQIGTETALETAAEYADDRSYAVEGEAAVAATALS